MVSARIVASAHVFMKALSAGWRHPFCVYWWQRGFGLSGALTACHDLKRHAPLLGSLQRFTRLVRSAISLLNAVIRPRNDAFQRHLWRSQYCSGPQDATKDNRIGGGLWSSYGANHRAASLIITPTLSGSRKGRR
jgi:hypothetical protein